MGRASCRNRTASHRSRDVNCDELSFAISTLWRLSGKAFYWFRTSISRTLAVRDWPLMRHKYANLCTGSSKCPVRRWLTSLNTVFTGPHRNVPFPLCGFDIAGGTPTFVLFSYLFFFSISPPLFLALVCLGLGSNGSGPVRAQSSRIQLARSLQE